MKGLNKKKKFITANFLILKIKTRCNVKYVPAFNGTRNQIPFEIHLKRF